VNLLTPAIEATIATDIVPALLAGQFQAATETIKATLIRLYESIPDNKRISYGRVYTIKILSQNLHQRLVQNPAPILPIAATLFKQGTDFWSAGVSLELISRCGLEDYLPTLPYFESAAAAESWDVREFGQMFFRKLIKKYPDEMHRFLARLAESENPQVRRFVAESLRPVQENQWFYRQPEYPLSILRTMFREAAPYPRTAVGNNLSDLARRLPELVFGIVRVLVESGDKNSYWIAYRACRNLVKTEPIRVLNALNVDEYTYKKRVHRRRDDS